MRPLDISSLFSVVLTETFIRLLSQILACLRSSGIKLEYLSSLGHHSVSDARVALYSASTAGVVSISADSNVRFTHDKQRVAATALIPPERKASIHYHIAQFTLESGLSDEYLFDSASIYPLSFAFFILEG